MPIDHPFLKSWIQPQHLDPDALDRYRNDFAGSPARLVVLRRFLADDIAQRLSRFLADEAIFKLDHGVRSVDGAVSEEAWRRAGEDDRFFRLGKLASVRPECQLSPNALTYVRFRQTFQQTPCRDFFQAVTGLSLGCSDDFGAHSMSVGDYLRPHSDDNRNRRIALVIYLSPGWDPAAGGLLEVTDPSGSTTIVEPEYNSMVVFDVLAGTMHQVTPIEPAAGDRARLTIGGWYPRPG